MSWRKYLLVPRLAAAGLRHRPDPDTAWQSYWSAVDSTGPGGEVLWDGAGQQELGWWRETTRRHFDRTLPVLDVGCGNGRLSGLLAEDFPHVLGIDVSPAAVDLARRESDGLDRVAFGQADITADGTGTALAAALGPANVLIRGAWTLLASGPVDITAARTGGIDGDPTIPGYHAVLRRSPR